MYILRKLCLSSNPHSQAQWQVAPAYTTTKTCHRACPFSLADFADTKKLNLLKTEKNRMTVLKNYLKPLTDKNAQFVTRA